MKKNRVLYLILPVITLILEILPYGAVCNYALPATDGTIGRFRELYSYFDLTPFGYANFAPFLTAIITCIILLLMVIYCITGKHRIAQITKNVLGMASVLSLCPLLFGIKYFSVVGALITVSLIAELLLLHFTVKAPMKKLAE